MARVHLLVGSQAVLQSRSNVPRPAQFYLHQTLKSPSPLYHSEPGYSGYSPLVAIMHSCNCNCLDTRFKINIEIIENSLCIRWISIYILKNLFFCRTHEQVLVKPVFNCLLAKSLLIVVVGLIVSCPEPGKEAWSIGIIAAAPVTVLFSEQVTWVNRTTDIRKPPSKSDPDLSRYRNYMDSISS